MLGPAKYMEDKKEISLWLHEQKNEPLYKENGTIEGLLLINTENFTKMDDPKLAIFFMHTTFILYKIKPTFFLWIKHKGF